MYQQIKILEDNDKALCLSTITDYTFASTNSQVPLAYYELFIASTTYPIMFTKTKDGNYNALAFLSLKSGTNLYISSSNSYEENVYKPAFFTNFPFIYATDNSTLTLAYDTNSGLLDKKIGQPLFNKQGEPTDILKSKIEKLNQYQNGMQEISEIIRLLDEAGVLITATEPLYFGESYLDVKGFMYIDEEKLNNLPEATLLSLTQKGAYKGAIAQLISLNNFERLVHKQNTQGN